MCALVLFGVLVGGFIRGGISYEDSRFSAGDQRKIIERVNKFVVLPENEFPQIARVSNPEVLKAQAFFAEAKVGDIVLIYSRKAVLYDPVQNKIIIVAPVSLGSAQKPEELVPKFQGEQINTTDPNAENQF